MKMKLLTICFAAAISIFNTADAMNLAADAANQRDLILDRLAIKGVGSLAEFAALPDNRVERLKQGFVADARRANTRLTQLSQVETLAGLLPLTWLPEALTTDLTTANTRLTGLSGAETLPQFLALDTSWLPATLVQAIRRADIKLNFNLPASLYENIEGIPADNTIGTQILTVTQEGSGQPAADDDVSKVLEILHTIIVTEAGIDSGVEGAKVDTLEHYYDFQGEIFPTVNSYTTANYLKFLSGILVDGRNAENDFSKIAAGVVPEFVYSLRRMIDCATDADLGIEIED